MADIIERTETALEGVTESPWETVSGSWGNVWHFPDEGPPKLVVRLGGMIRADAEFIAWARAGVPELVAELKAARAQRDEFRAQLEHSDRENERLRRLLAPPEVDPNWAHNTCCGKCTGGTCYVDQMTGA
jgi:hypothetical protein